MRGTRLGDTQGGFALVMVVMLLLAISVAGATGYQLVSAENELATGGEEQGEAMAVARAGLERYVGEHIGVPGDTTIYAVGTGSVTVTQKKIATLDGNTDMYLLKAVGTIPDARYPNSPATRTVRQYAKLHNMPVNPKAVLMSPNNQIEVDNGNATFPTEILGTDASSSGACTNGGGAGVGAIAGAYNHNTPGGGSNRTITGATTDVGNVQALIDTVQVRWSALQDPTFTIPFYDGVWPDFASLPADSFPVVRVNGNFSANLFNGGRGALIVTGAFTMGLGFTWDGIILAGSSTDLRASNLLGSSVTGMVVVGLDGGTPGDVTVDNVTLQYHECNVRFSNRSLAYFELIDGARWQF